MRLNVQYRSSLVHVVWCSEHFASGWKCWSTTDIVLSLVLVLGALNLMLEPSLTRMKKSDSSIQANCWQITKLRLCIYVIFIVDWNKVISGIHYSCNQSHRPGFGSVSTCMCTKLENMRYLLCEGREADHILKLMCTNY